MEQKMEQIFSAIVGTDNQKRAEAEKEFEAMCDSHTVETTESLLKIVSMNKPVVSQVACLMLQKRIMNEKKRFQKLQGNHIEVILKTATELVSADTEKLLLNTLGNIIVLVYNLTGQFLKFFEYVSQFKETKSDKLKIFMLNCLNNMTIFAEEDELLIENSDLFTSYFSQYMQDSSPEVKTAAACAFLDFLAVINEEKYINKFKGDLPVLVNLLVDSIKSSEENGSKMLEAINTISVTHPKFIRDSIDSLLNVYCEIIITKNLSSNLRSAALSNTVNLIRGNSAAVKQSKVFSSRVVDVMLKSLTEQEEDLTEWYQIGDDVLELSSGSFQAHIIQSFSSLNDELGAKFLMPKVIPLVFKCINSGDWNFQYAGLMTLAMVFSGARKYFESELDNFLKLVVPTIKAKHPKVVYGSMTCIALLAEEFAPDVQKRHSADILPVVTEIISNAEHDKLKLRGVSMCISYLRELLQYEEDKECVVQYVEPLMNAVIGVFEASLKDEKMDTIDEVLSLVSILAAILEENFAQFYQKLMPGLITLLDKTPNETLKQNRLRTLVLSTMGHMIGSYRKNPAPIKDDIVGIVNKIGAMQGTLKDDDSQHKAILEIYQILVGTLNEEFLPFMDKAMDQLVRCATREIKVTVEDDFTGSKTVADAPNVQAVEVDLKILGGKKILSVNHDCLEQKIQAFHAVKDFAKSLKKSFRPYLEKVVEIFKAHLEEKRSLALLKTMFKCIYHLLHVVESDTEQSELLAIFTPCMLKWANKYLACASCDEAWKILKKINKCVGLFQTQVLQPEFISEYLNTMTLALNVCANEKKEILEQWGNPKQMDAMTREDFEWEFDTPNRLMHAVMTGCMDLMKIYKEKLEQIILKQIGGYFYLCTSNPVVEDEIHYAACFYAEVFLYCSDDAFSQGFKNILSLVLPSVEMTEDCNYQQTASYLIGIIAKRCTHEQFQPFLSKSHKFLSVLLNRPDAWTEERKICSETVLGAFGKLCIYQLNNTEKKSQDELSKFLNLMPMKTDPEEAQVINLMFLEEVFEKKNPNVLVNKEFEQKAEQIVMQMKNLMENQPELEVLSDKGAAYLKSKLG